MLIYLCTFLLSFSVLLLEISLTRVFSVLTWHHFTHMIISISLLGFGAAGSYLTVRKSKADKELSLRWLSGVLLLYAISVAFSLIVVTRIHSAPLLIAKDPTQVFSLFIFDILVAIPFFFAGLGLASIITYFQRDIHRIYFADLIGASLGALSAVTLISTLGAVAAIFLVAVIGAAVALLLAYGAGDERSKVPHWSTMVLLLVSLVGLLWWKPYMVHVPPSKELSNFVNPTKAPDAVQSSRWNVVARVDVTKKMPLPLAGYGGDLSPKFPFTLWTQHMVFQDGAAPTGILRIESPEDLARMPFLDGYLQAAAYSLVKRPRVLVIGVGGGHDVLLALYHKAQHVTGAELNPLMLRAIQKDAAQFTSNVFNRKDVTLLNSEGRHFLSRTEQRFDLIQLSGVDTFTALSSGAYALAENYLYTVEAIEMMWGRLSERGMVSFSRWFFKPPRETLRLAATMAEMLSRRGVKQPARHIAIVRGRAWADTLLSREPFTAAKMETLRHWAKKRGFSIVFDPTQPGESEFDKVLRVSPAQREAFYQRYLYQIRPTSDDAPFFFNFYKLSKIFERHQSAGGYVTTDIPLGLVTLVVSLAQILLLALVGILVPMRRVGLARKPGRWATLAYFSALGVGFIFVEIALIQKLMVLLGGPAYSLSLTLFSILLFSGIGSLLARRRQEFLERHFLYLGLVIALLAAVVGFAFDALMPTLLGLGFGLRATLSVAIIAPMALVMGTPFPVGLSILGKEHPEWVPWAWATNSFMTVLGPLLCIFLGMQIGFRGVFVVAGAIYVLGFVLYRGLLRTSVKG